MSDEHYVYQLYIPDHHRIQVIKLGPGKRFLGSAEGTSGYHKHFEELAGALNSGEPADPAMVEKIGKLLFEIMFSDQKLRTDFFSFYQIVLQDAALLRVELYVDREQLPEVTAWPWELMYAPPDAPSGKLWFATDSHIIFARAGVSAVQPKASTAEDPPKALTAEDPLCIVLAYAAPQDEEYQDTVQYKVIKEALVKLANENPRQIKFVCEEATAEKIDWMLEKYKPHIFHFIGHARFDPSDARIILVGNSGYADPRTPGELGEIIGRHPPLMVLLQACQSAAASSADFFTSIVSQVLQKNVPLTVAMQYQIMNATAQTFALKFYECVAAQQRADKAVQEGRRAIGLTSGHATRGYATPVLFLNSSADGDLFKRVAANSGQTILSASGTTPVSPSPIRQGLDVQINSLYQSAQRTSWNTQALRTIYKACAPASPDWECPLDEHSPAATLFRMLDRLAAARAQHGSIPPVLEFVERLAVETPLQATELRNWITATAAVLGVPSAEVASLRQNVIAEPKNAEPKQIYLLIKFECQDDQCLVQAWSLQGTNKAGKQVCQGKAFLVPNPPDPQSMIEVLSRFVADIGEDLKTNPLTIEFILPEELLLLCTADAWHFKMGTTLPRIGGRYRVVVRSFDRIYSKESGWVNARTQWVSAWRKYTSDSGIMVHQPRTLVNWIEHEHECEKATRWLLAQEPPVYLALGLVPPLQSSEPISDVISALLSVGVPIAIWPRQAISPATRKQLKKMLVNGVLADLPELIHNLRKQAYTGSAKDEWGQHLTLLWDDPGRMPPDVKPLVGPKKGR